MARSEYRLSPPQVVGERFGPVAGAVGRVVRSQVVAAFSHRPMMHNYHPEEVVPMDRVIGEGATLTAKQLLTIALTRPVMVPLEPTITWEMKVKETPYAEIVKSDEPTTAYAIGIRKGYINRDFFANAVRKIQDLYFHQQITMDQAIKMHSDAVVMAAYAVPITQEVDTQYSSSEPVPVDATFKTVSWEKQVGPSSKEMWEEREIPPEMKEDPLEIILIRSDFGSLIEGKVARLDSQMKTIGALLYNKFGAKIESTNVRSFVADVDNWGTFEEQNDQTFFSGDRRLGSEWFENSVDIFKHIIQNNERLTRQIPLINLQQDHNRSWSTEWIRNMESILEHAIDYCGVAIILEHDNKSLIVKEIVERVSRRRKTSRILHLGIAPETTQEGVLAISDHIIDTFSDPLV